MTESITSLGKSEEWFWETEMRIVWNLIEEHKRLEKIRQKNLAIYIASFVWGKDIDEEEPKTEKGKIAGVDYPINPEYIKCLM